MAKRTGPVKINSYGADFKVRSVQLSSEPGVLVKDVAESLDIHPFMLSKMEHDLLKKSIRFASERKANSSPSLRFEMQQAKQTSVN